MTTELKNESNDPATSWIKSGAKIFGVRVYGKTCESSTSGQVFIRVLSRKDRLIRTVKVFAFGWGLGTISILIPLLHFLLVPVFFVGTVMVAWYRFQQETIRLGGATKCPKCGDYFRIIAGRAEWPFNDVCASCQECVEITKIEPTDAALKT